MYTKQQNHQLRDALLAKKATDTVPFNDEGDLFRFACYVFTAYSDTTEIENKIREYSRFDTQRTSHGLIYDLLFGDPTILPRYINSLFSIIVRWRLDIGRQEGLSVIG